ncbi:nickel-dependent hydrogenase large subunit [Saccharolobus islandicus]|nr:nickel-dependent hydrogenase large subunit [Sulfolobus islandicus]
MKVEESKDFSQKSRNEENELAVGAHDAPSGGNAHWIIQKGGTILRY